jgi:hypothetical protein
MSIVMHPLTALNGMPAYTADDYRHVVNPFLFPSDGSAFGCVQGVRYGSPAPLVTIDGLDATVKPHCGIVCPWENVGAYSYSVKEPVSVTIPNSVGSYKIAVTVEDPSQSHGSTPMGALKVYEASVPDADIPGLVVALVEAGVASDVTPRLMPDGTIQVVDATRLSQVSTVDGIEAVAGDTGYRYRRIGGVWQPLSNVQLNPGVWAKDWSVEYKCSMSGNVVSLYVKATRGIEWVAQAWSRSQILTFPDYVRPNVTDLNIPAAGVVNSGFQLDSTGLYVRPFADITYHQGSWTTAALSWSV